MAQVYEPRDLIERALKSLSLNDKLPQPNLMPSDGVPAFVSAFSAALRHRKKDKARKRQQEQRRVAAEKADVAAFFKGKTYMVSAAGFICLLDVVIAARAMGE